MPRFPFFRLALASALVAGCGAGTAPSAVRPTPAPLPTPAPAASNPAGQQEGDFAIAALRDAYTRATGAEGELKSYSEGHYKAGERVSELRKANYRTRMLWVKPSKFKGEILETDNFLVSGGKMVTTDGKKVKVKGGGVLGLFPITLDINDGKLASNRNYGFTDQAPDAMIKRLIGPSAHWQLIGDGRVGSVATRIYEVTGVPRLDAEITRETVAIAPADRTLRGLTLYTGSTRVMDVSFTTFKWNPTPAAGAFDL